MYNTHQRQIWIEYTVRSEMKVLKENKNKTKGIELDRTALFKTNS